MAASKNPEPAELGARRKRRSKTAEATDAQDTPVGNFISHLLELRNRLMYAVVTVGVVFGALLPFSSDLYTLLARPLMAVLPPGVGMIATDVASAFLTPIKVTLALAIVVSIPMILYQLWAFVAPGLYKHERRMIVPLLVSSTLLFYAGMAFAYFVVFPAAFGFFVKMAPQGVTMMTDIKSYIDFVYSMFFAFGIAFELPVALILLAWMGVIDPEKLATKRPYVVLWVFIVAAFITPPDVFSQVLLAVPMLILFEIGLFVARRLARSPSRNDAEGHRPLSDAEMEAEFDKDERENAADAKGGK